MKSQALRMRMEEDIGDGMAMAPSVFLLTQQYFILGIDHGLDTSHEATVSPHRHYTLQIPVNCLAQTSQRSCPSLSKACASCRHSSPWLEGTLGE